MQPSLPSNTRLIANSDVWMEGAALEQLSRVAWFAGCLAAVGMPDLHPGPGIPIGAAFAFDAATGVRPGLVGSDAGCGARLIVVERARASGDDLERRVRAEFEGPALPEADPVELFTAAWSEGPRGLSRVSGAPDALAELSSREATWGEGDGLASGAPDPGWVETFGASLGTTGGGNHFAEIASVGKASDTVAAAELGLRAGHVGVLVHSGSRGLGRAIIEKWGEGPVVGDALVEYRKDLAGALGFARANRLLLAWRLLKALGATRPERLHAGFDVVHNTVVPSTWRGLPAFLHRKGCAPAAERQPTLVLGSRGAPSWVMVGAGSEDALFSVAHGAGRRMQRSEAVSKLRAKYARSSLERTRTGGRVICDDAALMYEEHPDAYKPVEPVIKSLEDAGAANRVAPLVPVLTVKL